MSVQNLAGVSLIYIFVCLHINLIVLIDFKVLVLQSCSIPCLYFNCCKEIVYERWARKPVNHTSWVALVAPTDRPKSVRNRCLIELFCGVACVVTLPF